MSICQSEDDSCVACCGVLNLHLDDTTLRTLLSERTVDFNSLGRDDRLDHRTLLAWRTSREDIERSLPRRRQDVYVCPFAGWIKPGRAGCLIHPERTGLERSQNASFYGATICLSYDCLAKECDRGRYARLISALAAGDAVVYSRLAGDSLLFRMYDLLTGDYDEGQTGSAHTVEWNSEKRGSIEDEVLTSLFRLRLLVDAGPTSFELPEVSRLTRDSLLDQLFPPDSDKPSGELREQARLLLGRC